MTTLDFITALSYEGFQEQSPDFCPRMDPLPNTSDPDGICCPRRSTAQRWGSDSRVGLTLQGRSGRLKGGEDRGEAPACLMSVSASTT